MIWREHRVPKIDIKSDIAIVILKASFIFLLLAFNERFVNKTVVIDPMMIAINDAIMEGFEELNTSPQSDSPRSFDPEHQRCDHKYAYEELLPPKCREEKEINDTCSSEVKRLLDHNIMPSCSNLNNEGLVTSRSSRFQYTVENDPTGTTQFRTKYDTWN